MPIVSFKATDEQLRKMRRLARERRLTVSEYLRRSALPGAETPPKMRVKRHPVSGLSYNAAPGQRTPSLDEIRAILADFP
jgi:hypothetical protein